ncbi:MAG: PfkB family carbohydrate kinase [Verrucomicrobiia bacterium]|jgi:ribokinase
MSAKATITGLGFCGMDYLCLVPHIPLDDKVEILQSAVQGGGPSVNAIAAAARLGAATAFIGCVGNDQRGRDIVAGLAAEGVDVSGMKTREDAESAVGFCWIEKQSGKRSIAWTGGTARPLSVDEIAQDLIRTSKLLHLDGHQTEAAIAAAKLARQRGVAVSIDAGTLVPGIEQLLGLADIIIASEKFARRYTGQSDIETAAQKLFAAHCKFSAVTMGSEGSVGFDGRELFRCPAFKVTTVDTTGAGDAFHGAFVYEYVRGGTWPECLRFASAVAALKCTQFGGRAGFPDLKTTEEFLKQHE